MRVEIHDFTTHVDQQVSVTLRWNVTATLVDGEWLVERAELVSSVVWLLDDQGEKEGFVFKDRTKWFRDWLTEHAGEAERFAAACWSQAERDRELAAETEAERLGERQRNGDAR